MSLPPAKAPVQVWPLSAGAASTTRGTRASRQTSSNAVRSRKVHSFSPPERKRYRPAPFRLVACPATSPTDSGTRRRIPGRSQPRALLASCGKGKGMHEDPAVDLQSHEDSRDSSSAACHQHGLTRRRSIVGRQPLFEKGMNRPEVAEPFFLKGQFEMTEPVFGTWQCGTNETEHGIYHPSSSRA